MIRSVQPALLEPGRAEEEAAATLGAGPRRTFSRVTLPALRPAIVAGSALSFSRAPGEFGGVVLVAGNRPTGTRTAPSSIFGEIEGGNRHGAMAVSAVLPAGSPGIRIALDRPQRGRGPAMAPDLSRPIRARAPAGRPDLPTGRRPLIGAVPGRFALLVPVPAGALVRRALAGGWGPSAEAPASAEVRRAFGLSLGIAAAASLVNTVLGVGPALALARQRSRGRAPADGLVDLPFAVSPIVAGLMLVALYGPDGLLGPLLEAAGVRVVYAPPGMILATTFVTLPFVVREVVPVLRAFGVDQEQAAYTLGADRWTAFRRVTSPSIRRGLAYGVTLTVARSLGEFGALLVVSGNLIGRTQAATLYIHDGVESFRPQGAYAASLVLAFISFALLVGMETVRKRVAAREEA